MGAWLLKDPHKSGHFEGRRRKSMLLLLMMMMMMMMMINLSCAGYLHLYS
jgi:hypothetical protein